MANVGTSVWANPGLLYNATGQLPAVRTTAGNNLVLVPNPAYTGTVKVNVTVSDGAAKSSAQSFLYTVNNSLTPSVVQVADRIVSTNVGSTAIDLATAFTDSDSLRYTVAISDWLSELRDRLGLVRTLGSDGRFGFSEKYFGSSNGSHPGAPAGFSFMVRPDGKLYAYDGGLGILVADVGTAVYANPDLLANASPPAALSGVTTTMLTTTTLSIAWPVGYTGKFRVAVTADDGAAEARQSFAVTVQ